MKNFLEFSESTGINDLMQEATIIRYFEESFIFEEGKHDNGQSYIKIHWRASSHHYLQCTVLPKNKWYLDTIYSPSNGSILLLALFFHAYENGVSAIKGNARTNNEILNSQEKLEKWYRKFGFETLSQDPDGTKMEALVNFNRPLSFRLETLLRKIGERVVVNLIQSPPSASNHPQDLLSP